jgi:epoxide hydrolase A/B
MDFPPPRTIKAGEINMAVHEAGEGPPIILAHGFPELAYSWRHQMPALANAGYRVIAPDLRGYGGTDKPPNVADYRMQNLIGDLTGLMDTLSIERAMFVGHDWGALILWQMALLAPKRMAGLINLNIPFFKRPPINPITYMRFKLGKDFYIVNFQDSDEADQRFGEDPGRFIDIMMRRRKRPKSPPGGEKKKRRTISLLQMLDQDEPAGAPILSEQDLKVYADAFSAGGFTGPINWYRNWKHNWKSTRGVDQTVRVPTLFVGATDDVVVSPKQVEAMRPHIEDLEIHWIEDCGHWSQQEKPEELNEIMLAWLGRRYPARARIQ